MSERDPRLPVRPANDSQRPGPIPILLGGVRKGVSTLLPKPPLILPAGLSSSEMHQEMEGYLGGLENETHCKMGLVLLSHYSGIGSALGRWRKAASRQLSERKKVALRGVNEGVDTRYVDHLESLEHLLASIVRHLEKEGVTYAMGKEGELPERFMQILEELLKLMDRGWDLVSSKSADSYYAHEHFEDFEDLAAFITNYVILKNILKPTTLPAEWNARLRKKLAERGLDDERLVFSVQGIGKGLPKLFSSADMKESVYLLMEQMLNLRLSKRLVAEGSPRPIEKTRQELVTLTQYGLLNRARLIAKPYLPLLDPKHEGSKERVIDCYPPMERNAILLRVLRRSLQFMGTGTAHRKNLSVDKTE